MRVGTRLLILKLALAATALVALLIVMHLLLPGLLGPRAPRRPGENYVFAETNAARVAVPREGRGLPAGPGVALQLAGQLQGFVQAFCAELAPTIGLQHPTGKFGVNVFNTHAEASAFARERKLKQDADHPGTFYDPASMTLAVTLRPRPDLLNLVLHLATHVLLERAGGADDAQWSPWLAVGTAVCAEQGAWGPGLARPGPASRRDAAVVLALASRRAHVPLHMLARGGPDLFHGPLGSVACRESGLFVLFLLRGGTKRRQAFLRYIQRERRPGPVPPGTLESVLGTDLSQLEKAWLAFLHAFARSQ